MFWGAVSLSEVLEAGHRMASQARRKCPAGWAFGAVGPQAAYNLSTIDAKINPTSLRGVFLDLGDYERYSAAFEYVFRI
jgi:hypothetical protein